jgi:DNA-directed RNA polymerase subunit alpha
MSLFRSFQMPKNIKFEEETLTETYGKLVLEPLERGYGVTIGNSLRRVLLSSLEGSAVYAVRIDGVKHEFSSVKGIKEDIIDIILNVKKLRFKYYSQDGDKKIAKISMKGPADVLAKDIVTDGTYEVLNKEQYICSLDYDAKLDMELYIRKGKGYVPSEMITDEELPVDAITVDAAFGPIRKVNFRVEKTRVGGLTDYDRLILELWTDGSISPEKAVDEAARILIEHFEYLLFFDDEDIAGIKSAEKEKISEDESFMESINENILKPIEDLEISVRAYNCLKSAGIDTVAQLVQKNEYELLRTKNFGRRSLLEINEVIERLGLRLGMKIDPEILERIKEKAQRG